MHDFLTRDNKELRAAIFDFMKVGSAVFPMEGASFATPVAFRPPGAACR
jgi:hypothetical protein